MTQHMADSEIRTKGSLCSGVGALDHALPGELLWTAESNEHAAYVLGMEYLGVPNLGDITAVDWEEYEFGVDLLSSGDPCQSMSIQGRMGASRDARFLWPYVAGAIRTLRPREVFLENVQNLISVPLLKGSDTPAGQKGSTLKMRLDDLQAAGYASRWGVLGACAVGAPHHRHRWFLRARFVGKDAPPAERVLFKCGAPHGGGRPLLPTPRQRDWKGGSRQDREGGYTARPDLPTALIQVAAGKVPLLPTPDAYVDRRGSACDPEARRAGGHAVSLADAVSVLSESWGKFAPAVALWETIIGRPAPVPTVLAPRGGQRMNPRLPEWMMGYPDGYLSERLSWKEALRAAGNGVVTLQAATAYELLG